MPSSERVIIFGASVRAAAFSALRAHLQPWCADLFADADLRAFCPALRIPSHKYPYTFQEISAKAPPGPWMYTGGLENHPALVEFISANRPLWGNGAKALHIARSPFALAEIFRSHGIHFPTIHKRLKDISQPERWLAKPRDGAGGTGIQFLNSIGVNTKSRRQAYFQEFIAGLPFSAVYVGLEKGTKLLGMSWQLVGEPWLHARPFHYCGSIGPLLLEPTIQSLVEQIGDVLRRECSLRGLFGVDFILSKGIPWPVEVNPRYPASGEILEYGLGIQTIVFHRAAFDAGAPKPDPLAYAPGSDSPASMVGKAILFADRSLQFPKEGPWKSSLTGTSWLPDMPSFADIPQPGQVVKAGRPILTFFCQCASREGCLDSLQQTAHDLDHYLSKA
jgi:predicted ATP-grasp superfamily ATP-dependent carboligase